MPCVMSLQDMSCSVHTVFVGRVMKLYPKMTYNKPEVSVMLQSMTTLVIFHFGRCKLHTKNNCMKGKLVNIIMILNYFRRSHPIKSIELDWSFFCRKAGISIQILSLLIIIF